MNDWKSIATEDEEEGKVQSGNFPSHPRKRETGRPQRNRHDEPTSRWTRGWTMAGAMAWAAIAVAARTEMIRTGMIELLFLFGPLVIVPLGMELIRLKSEASEIARRLTGLAQSLQPLAAVLAVIALCLPAGRRAAWLATPWLLVCGLVALSGAIDLVIGLAGGSLRGARLSLERVAWAVARADLAVGGAWLVASRLRLHPMGVREPIGLLTAVHFHFAGFATAAIATSTLQLAAQRGKARWLGHVVRLVIGMPFVVAAGFVISPLLKMSSAVLFSGSVVLLAAYLLEYAEHVEDGTARVFLEIAAGAIFFGMALSTAYAVADFLGSEALPIPRMASTHGVINAVGFCLCGLLGWILQNESARN